MTQSKPPAFEGQDPVNLDLVARSDVELYPSQRRVPGRHAGDPLISLQNESEVMDLGGLHHVMLYETTFGPAFQLNLLPLGPRL